MTERNNIFFVRREWTPTGGAEGYLSNLSRRLIELGWICHLVCESWDKTQSAFTSVEVIGKSWPRFTQPKRFAAEANRRLEHLVGDSGIVFSMERGIRADVYRAGDGVHRAWLKRRTITGRNKSLLKRLLNPKHSTLLGLEAQTFSPEYSRCVIANSELVRQDILEYTTYPENRIGVVTNGVNTVEFMSGNRTMGRRAMGWKADEFVCVLVGVGAERKGYKQAQEVISKLSFPAKLAIVDRQPTCSMADLYAGADVFILPTLYDPFANVTLEAMAAKLPIITTRTNGAAQFIEHGMNGFLVDTAVDISGMVAAIEQLRDNSYREQIGQNAFNTAVTRTWETHIQETLQFLSYVGVS
ncbi:MAG: glycosyltransferase family 4 protein [Verrucomicrobiota bacterium]